MALIRELYPQSGPGPFSRGQLLAMMRDFFRLGALGSRIRRELSGDIRAAVRRGIMDNRGGRYTFLCRHIGQYDPSFLREQFLASLSANGHKPYALIGRDEAICHAARFLGFRRTGGNIDEAFRSAINSAIRRGELERDGGLIRRTRP